MSDSLPEQLRPWTFGGLWGSAARLVATTLKNSIVDNKFSGFYMLHGPPGTGKTTLARIFAKAINCEATLEAMDKGDSVTGEPCGKCESCTSISPGFLIERNAADNRGIDDARNVISEMETPPWEGRFKVILLDEAHQLTDAAQEALQTAMEPASNTYEHIVVIVCTTAPKKFKKAFRDRFMDFELKTLTYSEMNNCLQNLVFNHGELKKFWKGDIQRVLEHVARTSKGSPRVALTSIEKLARANALDNEELACNMITEPEEFPLAVMDLARMLILKRRPWTEVSSTTQKLLKNGTPPETLRMAVAGYLRSSLIGASSPNDIGDALTFIVDPIMDPVPQTRLFLQLSNVYRILHR